MPFSRPLITQLISRAQSDLTTRVDGLQARLRRTFEQGLSYALAGLAHGLYGYLFYISQQILPDTADEPVVRRWAALLGLTAKDPSFASGNAIFTGTNGTVIAIGSLVQRSDNVVFATTVAATIALGTATTTVQASLSGAAANTVGNTALTLVNPIAGITATATVDGNGITGGADAEGVEALRSRVLERLAVTPSGGGPGDYVTWALQVSSVTRAWEYPLELGAGTVVVRFATDNDVSPFPNPAKVAQVQAYLNTVAPVTAAVTAAAPTEYDVAMTIHISPDTPALRAQVTTDLSGYFTREASPAGRVYKSQLDEVVALVDGIIDHTISVPSGDLIPATGQLPVLGVITWV